MDVDKCQHLCKIDSSHYPREAESFEMRIQELRKSFGGFLTLTLLAATEPKGAVLVKCKKGRGITIRGKVSRSIDLHF